MELRNCTIARNGMTGIWFRQPDGRTRIVNSIVAQNDVLDWDFENITELSLRNVLVNSVPTGIRIDTSNVFLGEPLFADSNLLPASGSPSIDRGDSLALAT